ncbi:MAG: SCO family protein [Acidobacteria bacterium]|nr:MAG: SCO family protein [Acidobacteriota bacterium]
MTRTNPGLPSYRSRATRLASLGALALLLVHFPASGLPASGLPAFGADTAGDRPAALAGVGFDQRLNEKLPLDLVFKDEQGRPVRLADCLGGRPAILAFVYYRCPMLCNLVLEGLVRSLRALPIAPGKDFCVIVLSFNPAEPPALAAAKKLSVLESYGRQGSPEGWHFLTGEEGSIRRLAEKAGFRYFYDPRQDQYAHASGLVLLTPQGVVSGYLYGVDFPPRDLRLGLVEASSNRIGSPVDQLLLFCYHYDPATGRYTLPVLRAIRLGGAATLAGLAGFIFAMLRRDRRRDSRAS